MKPTSNVVRRRYINIGFDDDTDDDIADHEHIADHRWRENRPISMDTRYVIWCSGRIMIVGSIGVLEFGCLVFDWSSRPCPRGQHKSTAWKPFLPLLLLPSYSPSFRSTRRLSSSSTIISTNPIATPTVLIFECGPLCASGISSSTTT